MLPLKNYLEQRRCKFSTQIRKKHKESIFNGKRMKFIDKEEGLFTNNFIESVDHEFSEKWLEEARDFVDKFVDPVMQINVDQKSFDTLKKFGIWI